MRCSFGVLLALLVLAVPARAQVFVPVGAPSGAAGCAVAAGDVVVTTRAGVVFVNGARVFSQPMLVPDRCPAVAVAADGTAVVAGDRSFAVRRTGGSFVVTGSLGAAADTPAVAAAPGGWVTLAWTHRVKHRSVLTAAIVAPDGGVTRTALARARYGSFFPQVGLRPVGAAIVAWAEPTRLRLATTSDAGGAFRVSQLSIAAEFANDQDVSVSGGLLAWASADGLRVSEDGGPSALLVPGRLTQLLASRAADGTAVVAYVNPDGAFTVSRPPGAGWSAPAPAPARLGFSRVLARDGGQLAAAWVAGQRLFAAVGQAGGTWGTPAGLSSPVFEVGSVDLSADAAGTFRLLWSEAPALGADGRVRAAAVGEAASDAAPPEVTASFPARLPALRSGPLRLAVPVTCSEACDVRMQVLGFPVVRSLPAGVPVQLRVPAAAGLAERLQAKPGKRRLHVEVTVADAAGNVTTQTGVVAVRVIGRPLRSFKVGPSHSFEMFSRAGDRAVGRVVNGVIERLASGASYRAIERFYQDGIEAIDKRYGEVHDTAVGDQIYDALDIPMRRRGFSAEDLVNSA